MKKRLLSLILALMMTLSLLPAISLAEGTPIDVTSKNLFKITTTADFAAGTLEGLAASSVGDGALVLAEGAAEGTFTSDEYLVADFANMIATWNAAIYDGTSVEVYARAYTNDAWDDWFSWGEYGMSIARACTDGSAVDEYIPGGTITKAQFRAVLRRDSASLTSPVLRQLTYSIKGGDATKSVYEEEQIDIKTSVFNYAPAYSQMIRDPEIGGSICSPSTISVMLNARNPELDLLPEEIALSLQDFNYHFGNWAFTVSAAGLYGYEAYVQYADKDIMLQELTHGRSVGLSVRYSPSPTSSYPYLEGSYDGTGGHLITIIGYEYEDGVMDDEHLYFISSDTYSGSDATSFHRYKWTQLKNCWTNQVMYIIPSLTPEAGAPVTGVQRIAATLEPTAQENVYTFNANGSPFDLTDFTVGKTSILGRGVLAYTIEGMATTETIASRSSIVYANRIQVSANNTFFYSGIRPDDAGNLEFDAGDALYKQGVPEGESRTITVYAMANNGRRYTATITAVSEAAPAESEQYETVTTTGNLVHVNLAEGTLEGAVRNRAGDITLANGAASGVYTTPIYSNEWAWEYLMATINAVTPGASSVELQIRAVAQRAEGAWSDWFTWGKFGAGITSASSGSQDANLNMDTDLFVVRGNSSVANVNDVQFRVRLRADAEGNAPTVFGVNFTYKKAGYSATEAVYTGETAADALPSSASVDILPTTSYAHAGTFAGWRFENLLLMMVNSQGSDVIFEEAVLNGHDFSSGWGNWAYSIFKAGLYGHTAYTQFGATPTLVQQALADGNIVTVYVHGGSIPTTNSGNTSQVIIYAYETAEDGTVTFKYVCSKADNSELISGALLNTCTAEQLAAAIANYGGTNPRGAMYVVGNKVRESSVQRVPVAAQIVDAATIRLASGSTTIALPENFYDTKTSVSGSGVITYTLASEVKAGEKLAANKFYYDITVNADGTLALPTGLQEKLAAGDTANLYVIRNNGVTYTAVIAAQSTLDAAKAAAYAQISAYLDGQPASMLDRANTVAMRARWAVDDATSLAEIDAALALLDTNLNSVPTGTTGITTTVQGVVQTGDDIPLAPPQTGAANGFAPALLLLAAAAAFVLARKKRVN